MSSASNHKRVLSIGSNNWAGARAATAHLIGLGHRRIAWIDGPDASDAARDRLYGYRAALDTASIEVDPHLVRSGPFDAAQGALRARELLTAPHPPTAIMAADDELAIGALATARTLGIRVPEELSIMGFDDTSQAAWTTPPSQPSTSTSAAWDGWRWKPSWRWLTAIDLRHHTLSSPRL